MNVLSNKNIKIKSCKLNLSKEVLGKSIKIDNDSEYCINNDMLSDIIRLERIDFDFFAKKYSKIIAELKCEDIDSFQDIIGKDKVKNHYSNFLSKVCAADISDYYFNVLNKRKKLTEMIKDAKYDHVSSITGRSSIKEGFNYLTQKKEDRVNITCADNHSLVEFDIKSCEPSFLNSVIHNNFIEDIYENFGKKSDVDRAKKKIAIISTLYGASKKRVSKNSGMTLKEVQEIFDYFKVEELTKKIISEHEENGFFLNYYGRKIYEIASPLNYWLQSSSADYCHLAFFDLQKRINCNVKAIIHDAVIFEVPNYKIESIGKIKWVLDPLSNIKLRVDCKIIR